MSVILYLKKESDIMAGENPPYHNFDESNCLDIMKYSESIDLDTPKRIYNTSKIMGSGQRITGGYYYDKREIKISYQFFVDADDPSAFNDARSNFIKNWLITPITENIYLYRINQGRTERIKVKPILDGENYKNGTRISETLKLTLLCDIPFFEDSSQTVVTIDVPPDDEPYDEIPYEFEVENDGLPVPFIVEGRFFTQVSGFKLKQFTNIGFNVFDTDLSPESWLVPPMKVNTANGEYSNNGIIKFNCLSGTMFKLETGTNNLSWFAQYGGEIKIKFYKRYL